MSKKHKQNQGDSWKQQLEEVKEDGLESKASKTHAHFLFSGPEPSFASETHRPRGFLQMGCFFLEAFGRLKNRLQRTPCGSNGDNSSPKTSPLYTEKLRSRSRSLVEKKEQIKNQSSRRLVSKRPVAYQAYNTSFLSP